MRPERRGRSREREEEDLLARRRSTVRTEQQGRGLCLARKITRSLQGVLVLFIHIRLTPKVSRLLHQSKEARLPHERYQKFPQHRQRVVLQEEDLLARRRSTVRTEQQGRGLCLARKITRSLQGVLVLFIHIRLTPKVSRLLHQSKEARLPHQRYQKFPQHRQRVVLQGN